MPFTEDMSAYFRAADFGTAAVFSGNGATVSGILDSDYLEPMGRVQASAPVFVCPTADVPGVVHGHTLTIGSTVYKVVGVEPNANQMDGFSSLPYGVGVTVLRLEKQ